VNKTQAMAAMNPQAMVIDDMARSTLQKKGATYDEALGFVSSCRGVSCLAHYSLMPSDEDTVSRKACARELKKALNLLIAVEWIEACIEVFVDRHNESHSKQMFQIPDDIYNLLSNWENEWQRELGCADKD
jgi:hypothetical protein